MLLVVVETPLSAPTREGIEQNKIYARACVRDCLKRGEAPYASHLFFDQPGILDDQIFEEREQGMQAGFAWGDKAAKTVVYTDLGISSGMKRGIERAEAIGRPVEYRTLNG